ncbi:hypothetical protein NC77_17175 [Janthinobacterium lividum]|uniref:site-specific integrase n=1 Tax=Janthinobacterium lividum TaxID=29581 RepID=UPI00053910CC|nr:site-specific integrase [Janthinobacterium lividum]KHA77548.1 hypothetical protein NC77_17175 [Janthinobacterium lividum]
MNEINKVTQLSVGSSLNRGGAHVEALSLYPVESLQQLDANSARSCQAILGHGDIFGVWETPEDMISHFGSPMRRTDLRQRILRYLPDETKASPTLDVMLDDGVLWLTRLGLLMRMGPAGLSHQSRHRSLDASTVAQLLYRLSNQIVARGIIRRMGTYPQSGFGFALALTPEDLREFRADAYLERELRRLSMFHDRNLWADAPLPPKFDCKTTRPRGSAEQPAPERTSTPYQPIPDHYLAAMGPRVLWLIQDLGPNLIHLLDTLSDRFVALNFASKGPEYKCFQSTRSLTGYFKEHMWRDREGAIINTPPFPMRHGSLRGQKKAASPIDPSEWPIRTWASVANLAVMLQSAHMWIALLMMAGRIGEIMTLRRDCIEWERNGKPYVNGKTYKLNLAFTGEERQWPAPDILVDVLAQQVRLVKACEHLAQIRKGAGDENFLVVDREHLWASLGSSPNSDPEEKLAATNSILSSLAARIGLPSRPGGINLHPHRFRKTIARLAGLAIDGSPKVLMRLLGHKDIMMTLGYMLTDPAFAKEIDDITRELRIMRAQGLIEDMYAALHTAGSSSYGGHGGNGASILSDAVRIHEEELHRTGKNWDVDSSHELAILLTNNGQSMRLVSAHVACTKTDGEVGLCSNKKGAANTGNCQSDCINRIEEKTGRRDTVRVIPIIVTHAQRAIRDNDLLAAASYARQLTVEINRFNDIAAQWCDRPELVAIMKAVS